MECDHALRRNEDHQKSGLRSDIRRAILLLQVITCRATLAARRTERSWPLRGIRAPLPVKRWTIRDHPNHEAHPRLVRQAAMPHLGFESAKDQTRTTCSRSGKAADRGKEGNPRRQVRRRLHRGDRDRRDGPRSVPGRPPASGRRCSPSPQDASPRSRRGRLLARPLARLSLPLLLPGISRDPRARQSLSSRPWDASSASRPNRSNWPAPGLLSKSPAWAVDVALSANEDVQNSGLSLWVKDQ
jgi:hypothetical protein